MIEDSLSAYIAPAFHAFSCSRAIQQSLALQKKTVSVLAGSTSIIDNLSDSPRSPKVRESHAPCRLRPPVRPVLVHTFSDFPMVFQATESDKSDKTALMRLHLIANIFGRSPQISHLNNNNLYSNHGLTSVVHINVIEGSHGFHQSFQVDSGIFACLHVDAGRSETASRSSTYLKCSRLLGKMY